MSRPPTRRGPLVVVLAVAALLLTVVAGPARALPPRCPDGGPPPCEGDDPPPDPEPEPEPEPEPDPSPSPSPTPPPTVPPTVPPPPATWTVSVLPLVQDDAGLTGPVGAERFFMYEPVAHPGYMVGPGVENTVGLTPAGTSALQDGRFTFPDLPLPAGQRIVLRVTESGSPGVLCRTVPRGALPAPGTPLHILVAPPATVPAADLQAMASGFTGPVDTGVPGVTMDITSAALTPQADGIDVRLQGGITVDVFHFTYDYHLLLRLVPVTGTDLSHVVYPQAASPGTVEITSVGQPNGDALIPAIRDALLPKLRSGVPVRAQPAVNNAIHATPDVQWWRDQGFNVSMRRVTSSPTGLTFHPSLCRLGW